MLSSYSRQGGLKVDLQALMIILDGEEASHPGLLGELLCFNVSCTGKGHSQAGWTRAVDVDGQWVEAETGASNESKHQIGHPLRLWS